MAAGGSAAAWGLLWELSGLDATWLARSTRARMRRRIRESSAEQIARAIAKRAAAGRFTAANVDKAQAGLIATGRAAAGTIGSELINDRRRVSGYVREGSVDDNAARHFTVADVTGHDVLFENTLPIGYDRDVMPNAVVAADLATSLDTCERSAGLAALEGLRQAWLAANEPSPWGTTTASLPGERSSNWRNLHDQIGAWTTPRSCSLASRAPMSSTTARRARTTADSSVLQQTSWPMGELGRGPISKWPTAAAGW